MEGLKHITAIAYVINNVTYTVTGLIFPFIHYDRNLWKKKLYDSSYICRLVSSATHVFYTETIEILLLSREKKFMPKKHVNNSNFMLIEAVWVCVCVCKYGITIIINVAIFNFPRCTYDG